MVDDHQRDVVEEVGLPQLRGDAHVVSVVPGHQLVAADLDPAVLTVALSHDGGIGSDQRRSTAPQLPGHLHVAPRHRAHESDHGHAHDGGDGPREPFRACHHGRRGTCLAPTALLAAPGLSTATLNWTASTSGPSNGYQWEVRTSGAGGSGATGRVDNGNTAAGITTANATGLSSSTTYFMYVRANCGGGRCDVVDRHGGAGVGGSVAGFVRDGEGDAVDAVRQDRPLPDARETAVGILDRYPADGGRRDH